MHTDTAGDDPTGAVRERYLGAAPTALYLIRPDQHVVGRWPEFDKAAVSSALLQSIGKH